MTTDSSSYYPEKTELDRALDRVAALERERNTLYEAMREVCHAIGGYTTDGTSVEFLAYVPESVRLTVGKLEREMAEARRDGARYRYLRDRGFQFADISTGEDHRHNPFVRFRPCFDIWEPASFPHCYEDEEWTPSMIDAAIDAAMEAK